jgi:hypothetical protein
VAYSTRRNATLQISFDDQQCHNHEQGSSEQRASEKRGTAGDVAQGDGHRCQVVIRIVDIGGDSPGVNGVMRTSL